MRKPFLALCIVVVLIALGCVMWLSPRRPVDQSRASTAEASPRTTVSLQERVEPPMVAGGLQTGSGGQVRKWCEKHLRMSGVVWLTEGRSPLGERRLLAIADRGSGTYIWHYAVYRLGAAGWTRSGEGPIRDDVGPEAFASIRWTDAQSAFVISDERGTIWKRIQ